MPSRKHAEDFVREEKRRDPSESNDLVSTMVDTAARTFDMSS
jgi:hypothetical protein